MKEEKLISYLKEILSIPSPTGMTNGVSDYLCSTLDSWNINYTKNRRGTITAKIKGKKDTEAKALVSHLDTLGLIVSELKDNGRLSVKDIGYITCRMVEGARVTIHSKNGDFKGSILPIKSSNHIYGHHPINILESSWKTIELRVDEKVSSKKDLEEIGISVGDIVSISPGTEIMPSGFIISRFLDNHASTACLLSIMEELSSDNTTPPRDTYFIFTANEELDGSGARFLPENVSEMIAVDIAPVGEGQTSSEYKCTIAAKDYEMVYNRELINNLVTLCEKNRIDYCIDVFSNLSTDAFNVISSGRDVVAGYIGFGTDSSHAYERTHIKTLLNLQKLIRAYITD